ncbi:MAG: RHS repeat-associated core domain-containing protein [Fimbriimonadaceae bacterium]
MSTMLWAIPRSPASVVEPKVKRVESRPLTAKEMKSSLGRNVDDVANPYTAGVSRQSIMMDGVDLMTGNLNLSATDISFEGGYGIPVAVTRSYSSNNGLAGPMGRGWTLSVDIRTTAGGVLKSSKSGDRSTPVLIAENPTGNLVDPTAVSAEGSFVVDASGKETKINREADGVMMGPLSDKNIYDTQYEDVDGYQVMVSQTVTTPEDTVYVYTKQGTGEFENYHSSGSSTGSTTGNGGGGSGPASTGTPTNILKIDSITDRQGNVTQFTYTQGTTYDFEHADGVSHEHPLASITMPGGRYLNFTWGQHGSNGSINIWRINSTTDGVRTVNYAYQDNTGLLLSATSPGGRTTTYTYEPPAPLSLGSNAYAYGGPTLTKITDPRGLETEYKHAVWEVDPIFYDGVRMHGIACYKATMPNGRRTFIQIKSNSYTADSAWNNAFGNNGNPNDNWATFRTHYGSSTPSSSNLLSSGFIRTAYAAGTAGNMWDDTYKISLHDENSSLPPGTTLDAPKLVNLKEYLLITGDLKLEKSYLGPHGESAANLLTARSLKNQSYKAQRVTSEPKYNFQGNPIQVQVWEDTQPLDINGTPQAWQNTRYSLVSYAYHGADKYFQQKAVKDPAGRIAYTDYYSKTAAAGKKGQVYRVYDPKWAGSYNNNWTPATVVPTNLNNYSAEFDYDSVGRPTSVKKLQKSTGVGTGYEYTQTTTSYGGSGSPFWGLASSVTEDVGGSGHANRVTQTTAYDIAGRALTTIDAKGRTWGTTFVDLDGLVDSVAYKETPTSSSIPVANYDYFDSGVAKDMPKKVEDLLDGVTQDITYYSDTGYLGRHGQVATIAETKGSTSYTTEYDYTLAGEREWAKYTTPNGTSRFRYTDYTHVGSPTSPSRAFQTVIKQTGSGNSWSDSDEQFFYRYSNGGRLEEATFAHTVGTFGNPAGDPVVTSRAHQWMDMDAGGRLLKQITYWDTASGYTVQGNAYYAPNDIVAIGKTGFEYDYSNTKNLRTQMRVKDWINSAWATSRTETYGYDADLDYLTSVDYGDGLPGATRSWTYDAAGNRATDSKYSSGSWTYDWLNRMTASPSLNGSGGTQWSYLNDELGNRTSRNLQANNYNVTAMRYDWDVLNRAKNIMQQDKGASYYYRADGMRVEKVEGATILWTPNGSRGSGTWDANYAQNRPTTRYFYDGQMPIEEDYNPATGGGVTKVTRNALGARGIDMISVTTSSGSNTKYPVYDGHGNCVATLAKAGSSYSMGDWRAYDVWGSVRSGNATGDPTKRYCANLGHQADDESDLVYMRARYYEPASGRFVSQDPGRDGKNLFAYCKNEPINNVDFSGKFYWALIQVAGGGAMFAWGLQVGYSAVIAMIRYTSGQALMHSEWYLAARNESVGDALENVERSRQGLASEVVEGILGIGLTETVAMLQGSCSIGLGPLGATLGWIGRCFVLGCIMGFAQGLLEMMIVEACIGRP